MPVNELSQPFSADGGRVGVLLSHGFTGSPASVRPWGEFLAEHGYSVRVPRLPGHGTTWRELNRTPWQHWYAELDAAFDDLRRRCDQVVVGGLSMGGCLALRLAEEHPREVTGVVIVNPSVGSDQKQLFAIPLAKYVVPSVAGIGSDIKKPGVDETGYDRTPLKAVHQVMKLWKATAADLPKVTQPLLMFRSAEDHVVGPKSGRIIMSTVSSRDLTERILENSYHVATLDYDAPQILDESLAFVRRVTDSALDPAAGAS